MSKVISLFIFFSVLPFSISGNEIDLGNLVLEGEIRRPMLRKLESSKKMESLLESSAKDRLKSIEKIIFSSNSESHRESNKQKKGMNE